MTRRAWVRLDNASNIFLAARSEADPKVFRMSAEMHHDVDPHLLQQALDATYERYPLYHAVLRSGIFWHYLQDSDLRPLVSEEERPTCAPLYQEGRRSLLFRVVRHRRRIILEIFHALSDGTGALWFLTDLVTAYLRLREGRQALPTGAIGPGGEASPLRDRDGGPGHAASITPSDDADQTIHELTTDSFAHYFRRRRRRRRADPALVPGLGDSALPASSAGEADAARSAEPSENSGTAARAGYTGPAIADASTGNDGTTSDAAPAEPAGPAGERSTPPTHPTARLIGQSPHSPRQRVHRVRGTRTPDSRTRVVELTMPAPAVLALARAEGASLTVYLTALFFESLRVSSGGLGRARTVAASIPVNLRQFFPSTSARNFFATARVEHTYGEGPDDLGAICRNLEGQFRPQATPESLERKLRRFIRFERSPALRIVPRILKDAILRLFNWRNNRGLTVAVSNLGRVVLPGAAEAGVGKMLFHVSAVRPQFCAISHAGLLTVSFTSPFVETDHIREFTRMLTAHGVEVTVAAARVTEEEIAEGER